jgi:hypothetical protein
LVITGTKPNILAGKMQFYLPVLDDKVRRDNENPSVGILICKAKLRSVVEYTLRKVGNPRGVADYSLSKNTANILKGTVAFLKRYYRTSFASCSAISHFK